jgi:hypothetical protein
VLRTLLYPKAAKAIDLCRACPSFSLFKFWCCLSSLLLCHSALLRWAPCSSNSWLCSRGALGCSVE